MKPPRWPLVTADWNFWPDEQRGAEAFAAAASLGFSGIEVGVYGPGDLTDEVLADIAHWRAATGLEVPVVTYSLPPKRWPGGCLVNPDAEVRRQVIEHGRALAGQTKAIGAEILGLWLGGDRHRVVTDHNRAWTWLMNGVAEISARCAEVGITLAVEYKPGEVVGNADAFLRLADAAGSAALGLLLDTGHALYGRELLPAVVRMCGSRLVHVHLDDNYGDADRDLPPGEVHNFDAFFLALADTGYRGQLSFDLYNGVAEEGLTGVDACRQGKAYVEVVLARLGLQEVR
jgi:sugar phosphate isomerase/epimerase